MYKQDIVLRIDSISKVRQVTSFFVSFIFNVVTLFEDFKVLRLEENTSERNTPDCKLTDNVC